MGGEVSSRKARFSAALVQSFESILIVLSSQHQVISCSVLTSHHSGGGGFESIKKKMSANSYPIGIELLRAEATARRRTAHSMALGLASRTNDVHFTK